MARRSSRGGLSKKQKERLKTVGKWTLLLGGTYELFMILVHRRQQRRDAFSAALNAQQQTGKPLLVIGDPDGSFLSRALGRDHDCGDLCLDAKGCPSCPHVIVADPHVGLEQLGDSSHVVFVDSGVFESTKFPDAFLAQLQRVSGGHFFLAHRERWAIGAFSPFMKRRVFSAPPETPYLEYRDLPWAPGPSEVRRLAAG